MLKLTHLIWIGVKSDNVLCLNEVVFNYSVGYGVRHISKADKSDFHFIYPYILSFAFLFAFAPASEPIPPALVSAISLINV